MKTAGAGYYLAFRWRAHRTCSIRPHEKDGYTAVQVGAGTTKKLSKSLAGHVKNAKVMPKIIREFRMTEKSLKN